MMYNLNFSIASIGVFSTLIILYSIKPQLQTKKLKVYSKLLKFLFLGASLDILIAFMNNVANNVDIGFTGIIAEYILNIMFFVVIFELVTIFYEYMSNIVKKDEKVFTINKTLLYLPGIAALLLVITSPLTHFIFYIDSNGIYRHGQGIVVMYMLMAGYAVFGVFSLYRNNKYIEKQEAIPSYVFCILVFTGVIVQYLVCPNVPIAYFVASLALIVMYMSRHSPDYYIDKVSGYFNEDGLFNIISERIDYQQGFSVLMIASDEIDWVYRNYGPKMQMLLVRKICNVLEAETRTNIFRQHNRFYIIFDSKEEAEEKAEVIWSYFKGNWTLDKINILVHAKMLVINNPEDVYTIEDFVSVTNYFSSYNREEYEDGIIHHYDGELFKKLRRYETIKNMLKTAIAEDGLMVYFQPILSTKDEKYHSAEALVRLKDTKTLGYMSPEEFIPVAEQENLIYELGEIVLHKVCRFMKENMERLGLDYVEINLSGKQCMQNDMPEQLDRIIKEYGLPPSAVNFEITETSNMEMSNTIVSNIQKVVATGANFSLDDYGTGYSNLSYLTDIPFNIVKIDKNIVWAYFGTDNTKVKSILPSTVNMINKMNMGIVTEGVETKEQAEALKELGVEFLQGYYFSKPLCEDDFIEFLKEKRE